MKKLILTILTTITILGVNAQGNNLQFNRALYETVTTTPITHRSSYNISNAFTIPAGKVWKITYVTSSDAINSSSTAQRINNLYVSKSGQEEYGEVFFPTSANNPPLWLPEGTYDLNFNCGSSNKDYNLIFSGIEFNIVQ